MNVKYKHLLLYHLQEQVQLFLMLIQDCLSLNRDNNRLSKDLEMNDYRQLILIEFIDRYENSSYYKGKSDGPRKISIVLHKRFPEYGQSFFYEITEELENISFQLKEEGIVTFSKKSIPGNREIILNQEESSIKKIYQELKRVSIKEK